jgi:hypothetical protein
LPAVTRQSLIVFSKFLTSGMSRCRFIRSEEEDAATEDRWALRLAKRYYSKLYREYAIVDLSRYQVRPCLLLQPNTDVALSNRDTIGGCVEGHHMLMPKMMTIGPCRTE